MIVTNCRLFKVGYDWSADLYVAVFQTNFHLIKDKDLISEFPGYDDLEERANDQIDALLRGECRDFNGEPDDTDVAYELRAPVMPESWGAVLWTTTNHYAPEDLENPDSNVILNWWERAVRHAQLMGHLMEKTGNITWANDQVLSQTRHA